MATKNGKVFDFTGFMEEYDARKEPLTLKIYDESYDLPPELPAEVMLKLMYFQAEHGDKAPLNMAMTVNMLEAVFGRDQLEQIVTTHQLGQEALLTLFAKVTEVYNSGADDTVGNVMESLQPLTSSKTGRSSKRTS